MFLVIKLLPGIYKESFILPKFVDIEGVNTNSVVLTCSNEDYDYIANMKSNSSIRNLTILINKIGDSAIGKTA